jgi:phosphopantothenoylcysteine decarboxylase / phosphopantothenate---cysteine ligase
MKVVVGIAGGIAAYKGAEVVRGLVERGAEVRVAMTRTAQKFVSPLTFAVLSRERVFTSLVEDPGSPQISHTALARWADLLLVAPATAHVLARFALGLADDFLSTYHLAHRGPVLLAPAMETAMWEHPATREHCERLRARGYFFVGPEKGFLASGVEGVGRLADPDRIVGEAFAVAGGRTADLAGLEVLVTAGPTREPIDPVRFISNRSSGRMGFALAEAARDRGASVTLLAGPTELAAPPGVTVERFETAAELAEKVKRLFPACDVLAMAAAVADFIPDRSAARLHRTDGEQRLALKVGQDVLASVTAGRKEQTVLAFAAEEKEGMIERALAKMKEKGADLIVVNDVSRSDIGFDAEDNEVVILTRAGERTDVPRRSKRAVADAIWDAVVAERACRSVPDRV